MSDLLEKIRQKYTQDIPAGSTAVASDRGNGGDRVAVAKQTITTVMDRVAGQIESEIEQQREFFAEAIHQIKNPLAVLRANWEEELSNTALPDALKEKFEQNIETISRLSQLIGKLLILSQTEMSRSILTFVPVSLDTLLSDVIYELNILAETKNQEIVPEDLPAMRVSGDREKLYQLLFNIIDNAIKYTQQGGTIRITGKVENNIVMIDISDNGPGIPVEELTHIFKRFYRIRNKENSRVSGNGLGLTICKMIAEMHRGTINVKSETGKGTTFRILLPAIVES